MKRLGFCALLFGALVSVIAAQSQPGVTGPERASARPAATAATSKAPVAPRASAVAPVASHRTPSAAEAGAPAAAAIFEKYCSDCHTGARAKANIDFDKLTERMTPAGVAEKADIWDDVALMLESRDMPPPDDADDFPTDAERASAVAWIRASLGEYDAQHAGDPGRVTVRRLTSAEYAYAIRDLTGVDIKTGIDASSDSVGGEGFANFGDVQSVQDTPGRALPRRRQADRRPRRHRRPGRWASTPTPARAASSCRRSTGSTSSTRRRASASSRAKAAGRSASSATARRSTSRGTTSTAPRSAIPRRRSAAWRRKEGITGRFAEHIWDVVNRTGTGYPSADMIGGVAAVRGADGRREGVDRQGAQRGRRPDQEAGDLAQLVLRARRPGRRRRRRRDAAAVRRHDAGRQDDAHLQLRAEPALRPADARRGAPDRAVGRSRPVDGAPDVRRAAQGHRHAGRDLPQPARRAADAGDAAAAVRAGGDHAPARARAGPQDVPAARHPAGRTRSPASSSA